MRLIDRSPACLSMLSYQGCVQAVCCCFHPRKGAALAVVDSAELLTALDYFAVPSQLRPAGLRWLKSGIEQQRKHYALVPEVLQQLIKELDKQGFWLVDAQADQACSPTSANLRLSQAFALYRHANGGPTVELFKGFAKDKSKTHRDENSAWIPDSLWVSNLQQAAKLEHLSIIANYPLRHVMTVDAAADWYLPSP